MKVTMPFIAGLCFLASPITIFSQVKDSLSLTCPFIHGSGREPKEAYSWEPPDKKVVMVSHVDSLVRSVVTGTVTNVQAAEDNLFEIVINYKDYFFWYFGLAKPLVKVGQNVKAGQNIGTYTLGAELEFRMFKNEDNMDPRGWLECKVPKAL